MSSIRDYGHEMSWIHPDPAVRRYELRAAERILATLSWNESDPSVATGQSGDQSWTFRRLGFLNPHVVALDDSGKQVFRFDATMSGGGMGHAEDGHLYRWYANLWRAEWGWMDSGEADLVRFRRSFDVNEKQEGNLDLPELGRDNPNLEVLVLLGWYLIITVAENP